MVGRLAIAAGAVLAAAATAAASPFDTATTVPLVGADYYGTGCGRLNTDLLKSEPDPSLELEQMSAMHASGLTSLRLTINYTSNADAAELNTGGGAILVPTGELIEPYRHRLIRYVTDARLAGFADVTIAFVPYGPNSPSPWSVGWPNVSPFPWDPSLYDADWRFVRDVRAVTKQYGPVQSHFDLYAEGPPADYDPNHDETRAFIARLYHDYVAAYGADDVFVTSIETIPVPNGDDTRLHGLIQALRTTGEPLPHWWGFDIDHQPSNAAQDLAEADTILRDEGVSGSIALGENTYDNADAGKVIAAYNASGTAHPVVQVEMYPNLGEPTCVSAPFTADGYLGALGLPAPLPLRGGVDVHGRATLTTADGARVYGLKDGTYTLVVTDSSRTKGFRLATAFWHRRTTATFVGTQTWTVPVDASHGPVWKYDAVGRNVVKGGSFVGF
jgi:hypothetical protein